MDEHKKFQKPHRKSASIDGIISDGRQLGVPSPRSYQPKNAEKVPTLDSLIRQGDGFHPMRQSPGSLGHSPEEAEEEALLMDEPIVLDELDKSRGRRRRRHGMPKPPPKRPRLRKIIKRTGLALAILLLAGAGYLGYKFYHTQKQVLAGGGQAPAVCDGNVSLDRLKKEGDGRVNVLLLGIGGEEHSDGPFLTDTIMLASIDPVNNKVDLLSIPRDLYVKIPDHGYQKINAAYEYGKDDAGSNDSAKQQKAGLSLVDRTLEPILGIDIHYHAVVDFEAFRQMVNALGGVDVNVPQQLTVHDYLWDEGTGKNYVLNVQAGSQHFDGTRALLYARSRYTSARGDFDRSERQRLMMVAIKDKALSVGTLTNPLKINQLLDSLGQNVYTDFDSTSIRCLAKQMSDIPSSSINSLDLVTPPHDLLASGSVPGMSVLIPKAGQYVYGDIQNYVRNALRDGFLTKENAQVAVYNATNAAGLGASQATLLKSYGYNVTTVGSTPAATNPQTTTIVDLSKGADKYTSHYLLERYGVSVSGSVPSQFGISPPAGTSFVIILGKDVANSGQN